MNYYNEHDRNAAEWLRYLIKLGLIPDGWVDERDIQDVKPTELAGYVQCHFFAGIGGWPLALALIAWPNDLECWTGSCPCQPFSVAGKGLGKNDPRHLWPQFRRLLRQCRPAIVFGEQTASAAGRLWLDGVQADLEALAYVNSAADLCSASIGSPHIRQRLHWLAYSTDGHRRAGKLRTQAGAWTNGEWRRRLGISRTEGRGLGDAERDGCAARITGDGRGETGAWGKRRPVPYRPSIAHRLADLLVTRLEGHTRNGHDGDQPGRLDAQTRGPTSTSGSNGGMDDSSSPRRDGSEQGPESEARDQTRVRVPGDGCAAESIGLRDTTSGGRGEFGNAAQPGSGRHTDRSVWSEYEIIPFRDGKSRRVEPGVAPLVDGLPKGMVCRGDPGSSVNQTAEARIMRLKGYGNAINPYLAAEFILASLEALDTLDSPA